LKKQVRNKRIFIYAAIAIAALAIVGVSYMGAPAQSSEFSRQTNPDYYSLLPPKPSDFDQMNLMFKTGVIRDNPERINQSYWMQPEWFPRYSEAFLPAVQKVYDEKSIVIWSLGVYESQLFRVINKDWLDNPTAPASAGSGIVQVNNDSIVVQHRFWLRAAPGATQMFGVGLRVVYPNTTNMKEGFISNNTETIIQDPQVTEKYINASFEGPAEFTLGTYFPKLNPDYIRQIWVDVEISKNTPKGMYVVGVDASAPSKDYQEEQSYTYGLTYTDPNIGMFRGPAEFRLFIQVV
jgi:hypothetical protein